MVNNINENELSVLDIKILETLKHNGFSLEDKGTYFYKEVVEAVVMYLKICSKERERTDLQEQLLNPYSVFYFLVVRDIEDVSLEYFHKEIKKASVNANFMKKYTTENCYMQFAYYFGNYILHLFEQKGIELDVSKKHLLQKNTENN